MTGSTFSNPLCVRFGEGRILMLTFSDEDGHGVVLRDSGEPHPVGMDANMPPEKGVMPKEGEIYLHFTNVESALALRQTLDEAIAEMSNVPDEGRGIPRPSPSDCSMGGDA